MNSSANATNRLSCQERRSQKLRPASSSTKAGLGRKSRMAVMPSITKRTVAEMPSKTPVPWAFSTSIPSAIQVPSGILLSAIQFAKRSILTP